MKASGAATQEIFGSLSAVTSALSWSKKPSFFRASVPVRALSWSGLPGAASRYWLK